MVGVVANGFQGLARELRVPLKLGLLLGGTEVVLEAYPAGRQVPLGRRSNPEVAHSEALRILRSHPVCILDCMLVVDRSVLREAHRLEDDAEVCVCDEAPRAVSELEVLVVVLDGLVILPHFEGVDTQAVVRECLALRILRSDAEGEKLLVFLDRLGKHALIVEDHSHLVVGLQSLVDVPGATGRVCEQLQVSDLMPVVAGLTARLLGAPPDAPHVVCGQGL
mmetsp:Transcript_27004/g.57212  ORF Transcript_27004/g.57212 Transcript_27004/m.57212 type:complete len:222 (-) Transcript_27004:434-1099(-)